MTATNNGRNYMAGQYTAQAVTVSLHIDSPGTFGNFEVEGGDYARGTLVWGGAFSGQVYAEELSIPVPADTTVTDLAIRDSSGTIVDIKTLDVPATFTEAGNLVLNFDYAYSGS